MCNTVLGGEDEGDVRLSGQCKVRQNQYHFQRLHFPSRHTVYSVELLHSQSGMAGKEYLYTPLRTSSFRVRNALTQHGVWNEGADVSLLMEVSVYMLLVEIPRNGNNVKIKL